MGWHNVEKNIFVFQNVTHFEERGFVVFKVFGSDVVSVPAAFLALVYNLAVAQSIFKCEFASPKHGTLDGCSVQSSKRESFIAVQMGGHGLVLPPVLLLIVLDFRQSVGTSDHL